MQYRPIRRTQVISPFGVGALMDFRHDESLMMTGLDIWPKANEACPDDWLVREERLEHRLGMQHFRLPPDFRRDNGDNLAYQYLPFVRFPCWHYCPKCGYMEKIPIFGSRRKCQGSTGMCATFSDRRKPWLIPVRIVAVCSKGHIEDFPFNKWVHEGSIPESGRHDLRFLASRSSATLGGIKIKCSCGAFRSLAGAFGYSENSSALHKIGHDCSGKRPWLGEIEENSGNCGEMLRVVQRGASNVYFPVVVSSIYLPLWAEGEDGAIINVLENSRYWNAITGGLEDGRRIESVRCEAIADLVGVDKVKLREAAQKKFEGRNISEIDAESEEQFRYQEYSAIRNGRGHSETDLLVEVIGGRNYGYFADFFDKVCLIKKLRETRVLSGFTRLLPAAGAEMSNIQSLCINEGIRWRPAVVVRGEGIFIELSKSAINEWLKSGSVHKRIKKMSDQLNEQRILRGLTPRHLNPRFVMLHSFAHSLICQFSLTCGYGSAALRERIYCNLENDDEMNGLLIYTASGDSEGTLGGLVRQGEPERLSEIAFDALKRAEWCSSDPVCIESTGQGIDNANLAACHGCLLLPETCCEEGNRNLDRAMLIGMPDKKEAGFFSRLAVQDCF